MKLFRCILGQHFISSYMTCIWRLIWEDKKDLKTLIFWRLFCFVLFLLFFYFILLIFFFWRFGRLPLKIGLEKWEGRDSHGYMEIF